MRVTEKMLDILVNRINKLCGTPMEYMGEFKPAPNHYHIDSAYGGYKLVQTCNEGGGTRDITRTGYTTKRNLYNELSAFILGVEAKQ